jgi:hypothetical protein
VEFYHAKKRGSPQSRQEVANTIIIIEIGGSRVYRNGQSTLSKRRYEEMNTFAQSELLRR